MEGIITIVMIKNTNMFKNKEGYILRNILSKISKTLILTSIIIIGFNSLKTTSCYSSKEILVDTPSDVSSNRKVVYLTFDDGPSKNTPKILDILKENNIKATFFIIHPYIESHNAIVQRIYDEGHAIGNHTYNHKFKYVYTSEEAFFKDFNKQQDFIKSITGSPSTAFRFPGGSKNTIVRNARGKDFTKNIIIKLEEQGVHCYDWNVDSGDAHCTNIPCGTLCNNVLKEIKDKDGNLKNPAIVLMHDCMTKKTTVQALPGIIKIFKDNGYEFDILK